MLRHAPSSWLYAQSVSVVTGALTENPAPVAVKSSELSVAGPEPAKMLSVGLNDDDLVMRMELKP